MVGVSRRRLLAASPGGPGGITTVEAVVVFKAGFTGRNAGVRAYVGASGEDRAGVILEAAVIVRKDVTRLTPG